MRSDARRIIGAGKRLLDGGTWQDGRVPRTAFPLSKVGNKGYRIGNRRWRSLRLEVAGVECRVLITYSWSLSQYQALFGIDQSGDTKVVASLEYHPAHHDGWHAHLCCDALASIPAGVKRGPWIKRLSGSGKAYQSQFPSSDRDAFNMAARFFKLGVRSGREHGLL